MSKNQDPSPREFALTVLQCKGFHLSNRLAGQAEKYLKLSTFRRLAWLVTIVCIVIALRIANVEQVSEISRVSTLLGLGSLLLALSGMGYIYVTGDEYSVLEGFLEREQKVVIRIAGILPEWTHYSSVLRMPLSTLQIAVDESLSEMAGKLPRTITTSDGSITEGELNRWNRFVQDFETCETVGATEKPMSDFFQSPMEEA